MTGFGYNQFSKESEKLILNILDGFRRTPIYSDFSIKSHRNSNGIITLEVSKNNHVLNRFDFYADGQGGKIGSIAIYGSNLKGHALAIESSMSIFGLPVSNVSYEVDLVDVILDDYNISIMNKNSIIDSLLTGDNQPCVGEALFDSFDHVRYQNGIDVSGHNCGCHRQIIIKNNINGEEGYTITILNMDGNHPLWGNNVQMAPKQMKIVKVKDNVVSLIGFGSDLMGNSFCDYALDIYFSDNEIDKIMLKMLDRNINIEYLK